MNLKFNFVLLLAVAATAVNLITAQTTANPCVKEVRPLDFYGACADDCKKLTLCKNKTAIPNQEVQCDKYGQVCPPGGTSCVDTSDLCDPPTADTPFKCTSKGIFPDPKLCNRYFTCLDVKDNIYVITTCKDNEVFNEATKACKVSTSAADCVTLTCNTKMGNLLFSPYGTGKKYYALCTAGGTVSNQISMYQCADGAEFDRTPAVSACLFKCPGELKYAYSLDNTLYYDCRRLDGKLTAILSKCPSNTVFNPATRLCVPKTRLKKL